MRHRKDDKKLGRSPSHRKELLRSLVRALIEQKRVRTTLAKAKLARSMAEKMVTLGRRGTLAARRQAVSALGRGREVSILFKDIAPRFEGRPGGYTRIVKLGQRRSDGSEMALLEWVDIAPPPTKKKKQKKKEEAEKS